jgi:predicted membrane protein
MMPFQFIAYLSTDLTIAVPAFSIMVVLASVFFGPSFSVAQSIATVRMRAVAASMLLFIQSIIGLTLGAILPGVISDLLETALGDNSLSYAMVIVGLVNVWAAVHYFLGARSYRHDLTVTRKLNDSTA